MCIVKELRVTQAYLCHYEFKEVALPGKLFPHHQHCLCDTPYYR